MNTLVQSESSTMSQGKPKVYDHVLVSFSVKCKDGVFFLDARRLSFLQRMCGSDLIDYKL